jgi:hypothetical protein
MEQQLAILYEAAWQRATAQEQQALRVIAELGGVHNPEITQEELQAKARAYGVAWQVVGGVRREAQHPGALW